MAVSPHQPSGGASGACERAAMGSAGEPAAMGCANEPAAMGSAGEDSAPEYAAAVPAGHFPQAATNPNATAHARVLRMDVVSPSIGRV